MGFGYILDDLMRYATYGLVRFEPFITPLINPDQTIDEFLAESLSITRLDPEYVRSRDEELYDFNAVILNLPIFTNSAELSTAMGTRTNL